MSGIKGFPTSGKMFKQNELDYKVDGIDLKKFVTVQPIGSDKYGLDVVTKGYYTYKINAVIEAGSTDVTVVITNHGAKIGDVLRVKVSANPIEQMEAAVIEIVDANTFRLGSVLSAELQAGDTVDLTRPRSFNVDADGNIVTSQGPLQFVKDSAAVTVIEDTVDPSNNQPLPVKLTDVTGDINITAGDLNVQLSHTGATPDSTQIGDGTNVLGITASNEAKVIDAAAGTKLDSLLTELQLKADLTDTQPVSAASLPLPTGAATEAKQDTGNTSLSSIDGKLTTLNAKDFATETTLSTVNGKLNSLGQKASVDSMPVVLSSEQQTIQETMRNSLDTLDNIVNLSNQAEVRLADLNGAATEVTLASIDGKDFATQATLDAIETKTPSLGQATMTGSVPVTIASNQTPLPTQESINNTGSGASSVGINGASATSLTPTIANPIEVMIQADENNNDNIRIGLGFAPTNSLGIKLLPGQTEKIKFSGAVQAISEQPGTTGDKLNVIFVGRV
jgi:hypothetical protein